MAKRDVTELTAVYEKNRAAVDRIASAVHIRDGQLFIEPRQDLTPDMKDEVRRALQDVEVTFLPPNEYKAFS